MKLISNNCFHTESSSRENNTGLLDLKQFYKDKWFRRYDKFHCHNFNLCSVCRIPRPLCGVQSTDLRF